MSTLLIRIACVALLLLTSGSFSHLQAAGDGLRFTVEVSSNMAPAATRVTTSMQEGLVRTDTTTGSETTVAIIRDNKTYLLEPVLELAQVTPVRKPGAGVPAAQQKYWGLVDPLQVAPPQLPGLFRTLGARSLGKDKLEGVEVEAWVLSIPADVKFPLDNLRLYVKVDDGMPLRLDYQRDKDEQVQVKFLSIETDVTFAPGIFEIPAAYRLVEYEW